MHQSHPSTGAQKHFKAFSNSNIRCNIAHTALRCEQRSLTSDLSRAIVLGEDPALSNESMFYLSLDLVALCTPPLETIAIAHFDHMPQKPCSPEHEICSTALEADVPSTLISPTMESRCSPKSSSQGLSSA